MALLNGNRVSFVGLSFSQIGEHILERTSSVTGKGLRLVLDADEEKAFENFGGLAVGRTIANLIADAVEKKTGTKPDKLDYVYHRSRTFVSRADKKGEGNA